MLRIWQIQYEFDLILKKTFQGRNCKKAQIGKLKIAASKLS